MENPYHQIDLDQFKQDLLLLSLYVDKKRTTEACLKKRFPYTATVQMAPARINALLNKKLIRTEQHEGQLILKRHAIKIGSEIEKSIRLKTGFMPEAAAVHNRKRPNPKTDRKVRLNNDVFLSCLYSFFFSHTLVRGNGEIIQTVSHRYPKDNLWKLQHDGYIEHLEFTGYYFFKPEGVKKAKELKALHFGGIDAEDQLEAAA